MSKKNQKTVAPSEVQKRVLTRQSGPLRLRQNCDDLTGVLDQIRDDLAASAQEMGAHVGRVTVTLEVLRPKVDSDQ